MTVSHLHNRNQHVLKMRPLIVSADGWSLVSLLLKEPTTDPAAQNKSLEQEKKVRCFCATNGYIKI